MHNTPEYDEYQSVDHEQRFTAEHPCPICGGSKEMPQGEGERCWGFLGEDGDKAFCTREEFAGDLEEVAGDTNAYCHLLEGFCPCGGQHDLGSDGKRILDFAAHVKARVKARPANAPRERRIARKEYVLYDPDGTRLARPEIITPEALVAMSDRTTPHVAISPMDAT
jgi:hypothetical protein